MALKEMYEGIVNSPMTELADDIDATQTTIEIVDGNALPDAPNLASIGVGEDVETIMYATKNGTTLSDVTRGFEGVAKDWDKGVSVVRWFTAYDYNTLVKNIKSVDDKADGAIKESEKGAVGGVAKQDEFADLESGFTTHLAESMPHPITNKDTNIKYKLKLDNEGLYLEEV